MATLPERGIAGALPVHHSWIENREVEGRAGVRPALNPATGRAFAQSSLLDEAQAASALAAARAALPAWSATSFEERRRLLLTVRAAVLEQADEIARLIEREQGKPRVEAHAVEVIPALESLAHLARAESALRDEEVASPVPFLAAKECRVQYVPYGVVLVITPWNYPFFLALSGVATALAAGNTVVLKPAPAGALVGLKLGALFRDAGVPDGALSVVSVDDALAAGLVEDPRVGKILFIGSAATGRKVMAGAARNLTPVVLELGGKDPAIICRDADVDQAARGIVWGAFVNAGQTCVSVERVYVEAGVADAFTARVVEETRRLRIGDPAKGEVDVGPLTTERQLQLVEEHVADAVSRGAVVLTGGRRLEGPGYFYTPTVLSGVDHSMRIMRDETFGPLLPIMSVASLEEAVRLANDSEYGLTASAWTSSAGTARLLQDRLAAGVVTVNDCVSSLGDPAAPYGGVKRSGFGRAHGVPGLREMTQVKYVTRDPRRRALPWWYPYTPDHAAAMAAAGPALHGASLKQRLPAQLALLRSRRLWARMSPLELLRNIDKLL